MSSTAVEINVELIDTLTGHMCSQLAIEFIKYIAYHRQQIPFPYKQLKSVLTKKEELGRNDKEKIRESNTSVSAAPSWKIMQVENEFRKVRALFDSMQAMFEHLEEELSRSSTEVEEVVVVLGATPFSPKDVFRLQFPHFLDGHSPSKHPHQRNLLQLLRSLVTSEELHSVMRQPLAPTNLYIFLRKRNGTPASVGFVVKERYNLPSSGRHSVIKLSSPLTPTDCSCAGVNIFQDVPGSILSNTVKDESDSITHCLASQWLQAQNVLKGFKDLKVNGVSVTSLWLQGR